MGKSKGITNPINNVLQEQMPLKSLEPWAINNCAEFNAVNVALEKGVKYNNLVVTTVKVSDLSMAAMCRNCQESLQGVLFVVSG